MSWNPFEIGDIVTAKYPYGDFYGCKCAVTYIDYGDTMDVIVLEGCYKGRWKEVHIHDFKSLSICDYNKGYYRKLTYNDWLKKHNGNT